MLVLIPLECWQGWMIRGSPWTYAARTSSSHQGHTAEDGFSATSMLTSRTIDIAFATSIMQMPGLSRLDNLERGGGGWTPNTKP